MNRYLNWLYFLLFIISRLYILAHPPYYRVVDDQGQISYQGYSDVQHDSERYANMWYYGLTPYREHLFEYPPAAIPIMLIPLLVDQAHIGHYYLNYRVQIFLFELILFTALLKTVHKIALTPRQRHFSLLFYIFAGILAKDFWYDGLDLVFFGSLTLSLIWRYWRDQNRLINQVIYWVLYWLSVAIKLLTLPLLIPFFLLGRKNWRRELKACILGALTVWGIPAILFRSSLSVFLFFHGTRPIKYESLPAAIIRAINDFTHTETQTTILPHLPVIGPVSTVMDKIISITFPAVILTVLIWAGFYIFKLTRENSLSKVIELNLSLKITLVYIFALLLSSKILSRPFHLWYVPLITIYPFPRQLQQLVFFCLTLIMLALDTSPYLPFPPGHLGPLAFDRFRDMLRFAPMFGLLALSLKLSPRPGKMKP